MLSLFFGAALVSGGGKLRNLVLMAAGLWLLPSVQGHNWLRIRARSGHQAATFRPCKPRLSATSIHVQVGPGQAFGLSWATGHDGLNRFVMLKGDDEQVLGRSDLDAWIDDYVKAAPASLHMNPANRRIHSTPGGPIRNSPLLQAQNISIHHVGGPYGPDSNQYKFSYHYNDSALVDDKYVAYKSAKYPFIWAGAYPIRFSSASNGDSVNVTIPVGTPPGHYVLHYRWSGYYDCVDVDVQPQPVQWIYGDPTKQPTFKYTKVDHCTFTAPLSLVSNCRTVTGNARACLEDTPIESVSGRLGFQVSPIVLPDTVPPAFRNVPIIPWNNNQGQDWSCHRGSGSGKPIRILTSYNKEACQAACEADPNCFSYDYRTHTDTEICLGATLERHTEPNKSDLCRLGAGNSLCPLGCILPGVETVSVYCTLAGQPGQVCRVPIDEGCRLFGADERPNLGFEGPLGRRYCSRFGVCPQDPAKTNQTVPKNSFACWAVEPRAPFTMPTPGESYDTVDDPEDPKYYSTCYVREVITPFLPQQNIKAPPKVPWFSNGKCVDCQVYADNLRGLTDTFIPVPKWDWVDKCVNCDKYPATASALPAPTPPTPRPGLPPMVPTPMIPRPRFHFAPPSAVDCDVGTSVDQAGCLAAARSILPEGKTMLRDTLQVGSGAGCGPAWDGVPKGCSSQTTGDWAAHFNTGAGTTCNAAYQVVCTLGLHLSPPTALACDYGRPATQAECEAAAKTLVLAMGKSPGRPLQVGSNGDAPSCGDAWGRVPKGCSTQTQGDSAAHFNTGAGTTCNAGYQLVCVVD